jgi:hypothetical protein
VDEETLDDDDEKEGEITDGIQTGVEGIESGEKAKQTQVKGGVKEGSKTSGRRKTKDLANYCRLKIKNKNSKANGRGFGRRR